MIVGIPKEIKNNEYRVGLVPGAVYELIRDGHEVLVTTGAGAGIQFSDEDYQQVGAKIVATNEEVYGQAEMIVKVKEPLPSEYGLLRENQILFTYLHLAADLKLTQALIDSKCIAIAYETVTDSQGQLPLLSPMSEVAGRLSIQVGAHALEQHQGGRGVLLGGVPGVARGNVVIIGGGVVGLNALKMAIGMHANVTVLDKSLSRLRELELSFGNKISTRYARRDAIEEEIAMADLVIGAVLVPGASAPKLVSRKQLSGMLKGSVMVDVAIDQGGCFETSKPTTHDTPTYVVDDIVHYCVTNMPGAVPRTSSFALNNVTTPFAQALANKNVIQALKDDPHLQNGLNVYQGKVTYKAVAESLQLDYTPTLEVLS